MKKQLICIICLILALCLPTVHLPAQGLLFTGGKQAIKERTSYRVFKEGCTPSFKKSFRLSFDLSIRDFNNFGYIFSLRNGGASLYYSFTYIYINDKEGQLKFNTDGVVNHLGVTLENEWLKRHWIPVVFDFDLQKDELRVEINSQSFVIDKLQLSVPFVPELSFGRHDYILDIPSFAIRNLCVEGDDKSFCFPLNENSGGIVHEKSGKELGWVECPTWMINDAYHWKLIYEGNSSTPAGIAFHEHRQEMWIFTQDSVSYLPLEQGCAFMRSYAAHIPVNIQLATHFVNTTDGKLYVYELNNLPIGDITTAALDTAAIWEPIGTASLPVQLHHHVGFWSEKQASYNVFGGFGNKRYNDCFLSYAPHKDKWDTLCVEGCIEPRYFSGMAVARNQNKLFIYGGMGNESGEQSVGRNYYHDLYAVDLNRNTISKCWGGVTDVHRVPSRNMVLSADERYIYLLVYPEYVSNTNLQLHKLSVKDGQMQALGDSIPMTSDEIATNANLYFNQLANEFYCTVVEYSKSSYVKMRIYSLAAPPVSLSELKIYDQKPKKTGGLIWGIAGLLVVFLFIYEGRKRKEVLILLLKRKSEKQIGLQGQKSICKQTLDEPVEKIHVSHSLVVQPSHDEHRVNAVYLFGSFTIYDRNGINISHLFSTRLRHLFIYFMVHSIEHGVASASLNEIFWGDKPDNKVKNLKGVTINQLRKVLAELEGIELIYEKGYFKIVMQSSFYCDFLVFVNWASSQEGFSDEEMMDILGRGKFLLGENFVPFDQTKAYVENFLASYFPLQLERFFKIRDDEHVIRLANIALSIDPLNETALACLVYVLVQRGDNEEAILKYSAFIKEYRKIMNHNFHLTYQYLVQNRPFGKQAE